MRKPESDDTRTTLALQLAIARWEGEGGLALDVEAPASSDGADERATPESAERSGSHASVGERVRG
jgi:hypothetical protein